MGQHDDTAALRARIAELEAERPVLVAAGMVFSEGAAQNKKNATPLYFASAYQHAAARSGTMARAVLRIAEHCLREVDKARAK